jgi:predicted tellurium resistance membrane protein TerC
LVEGFGVHIPKGYIYFAMAFSLLVDVVQMKVAGRKSNPVRLNEHFSEDENKK